MPETSDSNAEQITYWNEVGGPKWVRYVDMLDGQLQAIGETTMDAATLAGGDAVLDIGCGCGATTMELARRVGAGGRATGLDISRPMVELARRRAEQAGLTNADFLEADAQTFAFEPEFDVVYSRFGVMFFDDPVRAFANMRSALKPRGRVAFACWQALHRNPWMTIPMMAAMKHVQIETPADPEAPGPFAFADAGRVERILTEAGYSGVAITGLDVDLSVGGGLDLDDTVQFLIDLGPLSRLLGDLPEQARADVGREIRLAIESHAGDGGISMPGAVWVATASA